MGMLRWASSWKVSGLQGGSCWKSDNDAVEVLVSMLCLAPSHGVFGVLRAAIEV